MSDRDYYEILGLTREASANEIKSAYRKLAMQYHPDKNSGDKVAEDKFKEISEAYSILSDPQKRRQYDQFGKAGMRGGGGFGGFEGGYVDPFDIFREVFGGGFGDIFGMGGGARRRPSAKKGADLQIRLNLTLEEVASGVEKKIKIKKFIRCETCDGSGAKPGTSFITCTVCHGRGEVAYRQGFFTVTQTCQNCGGEGKTIDKPCETCKGEGRVRGEDTLDVNIPSGVAEGQYLTLRSSGNVGPKGGPIGDVIVIIEEQPHEYFERHGDDIVYNLHLGFPQAALGEEIEIPTLTGKAKIQISPGTQSGKILRMKGKGLPHLNSYGSGDQLIRVMLWTPVKLSAREKELLKELAQLENMRPKKEDKSFFERMKEAIL